MVSLPCLSSDCQVIVSIHTPEQFYSKWRPPLVDTATDETDPLLCQRQLLFSSPYYPHPSHWRSTQVGTMCMAHYPLRSLHLCLVELRMLLLLDALIPFFFAKTLTSLFLHFLALPYAYILQHFKWKMFYTCFLQKCYPDVHSKAAVLFPAVFLQTLTSGSHLQICELVVHSLLCTYMYMKKTISGGARQAILQSLDNAVSDLLALISREYA